MQSLHGNYSYLEAIENLFEEPDSFILGNKLLLFEIDLQIASITKFSDNENRLISVEAIHKSNNIFILAIFENFYFSFYQFL